MRIGLTKKCKTVYNITIYLNSKRKKKEKKTGRAFYIRIFFTSGNQINGHVLVIYKYNINKHIGTEGEVRVLMNTLNYSFFSQTY